LKLRIKSPWYVELYGLKDFGRLVCALERVPLPSFALSLNGAAAFAVQLDFVNGRPVIFFVKNGVEKVGEYLAYRIVGELEEVVVVDFVSNPTFVYSPIVKIDKSPESFSRSSKVTSTSEYVAIRLMDLSSLAKVCAYKTIYEEPPLPLLVFDQKIGDLTKYIIGAPMSVSESDTISYFYYVVLDNRPEASFLRYSSQKSDAISFFNRIDEHGYIYLKLIRLAKPHPLVRSLEFR
jgi:hypothetical protein